MLTRIWLHLICWLILLFTSWAQRLWLRWLAPEAERIRAKGRLIANQLAAEYEAQDLPHRRTASRQAALSGGRRLR